MLRRCGWPMSKTLGNPFDPPIRQLKPAIKFLRQLDVPATRIAAAFSASADHVRHLDSRTPDDHEVFLPASISELARQFQNTSDTKDAFGTKGRLSRSS